VLTAAFALSHAFRTVVTLVAMSLRSELALGNETIGLVGDLSHHIRRHAIADGASIGSLRPPTRRRRCLSSGGGRGDPYGLVVVI
jgi:hypothetical protein